jgi:hypothetical protein
MWRFSFGFLSFGWKLCSSVLPTDVSAMTTMDNRLVVTGRELFHQILVLQNPSPETHSSFLNRQTLWWFNKIPATGIKKPLVADDLFNLDTECESKHLVPIWDVLWNKAMRGTCNKLCYHIVIVIATEYHQRKLAFEQTMSEHDTNDMTPLLLGDSSKKKFSKYGATESNTKKSDKLKNQPQPPSVVWRLFIMFWPDFVGATLVKILSDVLQFANPQLLE